MDAARNYLQTFVRFLAERPAGPPPPTPVFDRFCIVFLALDWVLFGTMHFSDHDATVRMLPDGLPAPDMIVVMSGIVEVTVGILLFYRRARRAAALVSLILLVLYIAPVAHILATGDGLNPVLRMLLVPHNVFMAICSIHVLRHPYPSPWPVTRPERTWGILADVNDRGAVALVAFVLLLCNSAGFLAVLRGVMHSAAAAMWMMMCLAVGALLGFLFAVPRANKRVETQSSLLPNRNIEAISDWLTKILVGLGLVNFKSIGEFLSTRSETLAITLGTSADFSMAFIVYFTVAGFLEGYIITRMFLQLYFMADRPARGG